MTETPPCEVVVYNGNFLEEKDYTGYAPNSNREYYSAIAKILNKYSVTDFANSMYYIPENYVWSRTSDGWKKIDRDEFYESTVYTVPQLDHTGDGSRPLKKSVFQLNFAVPTGIPVIKI